VDHVIERERMGHHRSARPIRWPSRHEWLAFAVQVVLVGMVQLADDVIRGNFLPPSAGEALRNAHTLVRFEIAHGFFVEPGVQQFFQQSHHLFGVLLTWSDVEDIADSMYAACHIGVTLLVVAWIFVRHRQYFPLVRNTVLFVNLLALAGYQIFPLAPPRLTTGLVWHGRPFRFDDTIRPLIGVGKLHGTTIGYNPFSAMPSLHVAWALVVGAAVIFLASSWLLRCLGVLYPFIITWATVVTANHYVMDAIGAAIAVLIAAAAAGSLEWRWRHAHAWR